MRVPRLMFTAREVFISNGLKINLELPCIFMCLIYKYDILFYVF